MSVFKVGDRLTFTLEPGCEMDITIEELDERPFPSSTTITRATVHEVKLSSPMKSLGFLPPGWVYAGDGE